MDSVLAHAHLPHEPVLVAVHARELPDVGKDVLQTIGQLEGVHVASKDNTDIMNPIHRMWICLS